MKIVDSILFFNEIDLLKVRLAEHFEFVDRFYVIEAARTFSNLPKPLYFLENKDEFSPWSSKIVHIVVPASAFVEINPNLSPQQRDDLAGRNEATQRAAALDSISDADYLLALDVDEIISRESFPSLLTDLQQGYSTIAPKLDLFYYFMNTRLSDTWIKRRIFRISSDLNPEVLSTPGGQDFTTSDVVGWHFSYLGGAEQIAKKVESFSHHAVMEQYIDTDAITKKIADLQDLFDRDNPHGTFQVLQGTRHLPKYVVDNFEGYQRYLYG